MKGALVRRNGFSDPINVHQIFTWLIILLGIAVTNLYFIPHLRRKFQLKLLLTDTGKYWLFSPRNSEQYIDEKNLNLF